MTIIARSEFHQLFLVAVLKVATFPDCGSDFSDELQLQTHLFHHQTHFRMNILS